MHLVLISKEILVFFGSKIHFCQKDCIRFNELYKLPEIPEDLMRIFIKLYLTLLGKHMRGRINSESMNPQLKPEVHDPENFLLNSGIRNIEVGLMWKKCMKVIGLCHTVILPIGTISVFRHHIVIIVLWFLIFPDVKIAIFGVFALSCFLEPEMFVRGMIHCKVNKDLNSQLFRSIYQLCKMPQVSQAWIYFIIVPHIIAVIAVWSIKNG